MRWRFDLRLDQLEDPVCIFEEHLCVTVQGHGANRFEALPSIFRVGILANVRNYGLNCDFEGVSTLEDRLDIHVHAWDEVDALFAHISTLCRAKQLHHFVHYVFSFLLFNDDFVCGCRLGYERTQDDQGRVLKVGVIAAKSLFNLIVNEICLLYLTSTLLSFLNL